MRVRVCGRVSACEGYGEGACEHYCVFNSAFFLCWFLFYLEGKVPTSVIGPYQALQFPTSPVPSAPTAAAVYAYRARRMDMSPETGGSRPWTRTETRSMVTPLASPQPQPTWVTRRLCCWV